MSINKFIIVNCFRLPAPRLIDASILSNIIGDAFAIAIVAFAISVSLAKMYAQIEGYSVDANQVCIVNI